MSIVLPSSPKPAAVVPSLMTWGRPTSPVSGGRTRFLERIGSRFRLAVQMPPMEYDVAREWMAARLLAMTSGDTVVFEWPQPPQASLGTPLVNGASQLGSSLIADGFSASAAIPAFAFFSFEEDSHHYLHATTASGTASGGGAATLSIGPKLRVSPDDNAALNFTAPKIEGFMDTGDVEWNMDVLMHTYISFTIIPDR